MSKFDLKGLRKSVKECKRPTEDEHDHIVKKRAEWDLCTDVASPVALVASIWSWVDWPNPPVFVASILLLIIYAFTVAMFAKWTFKHVRWHMQTSGNDAGEGKESDGTHE